jgi:hypothetical protein
MKYMRKVGWSKNNWWNNFINFISSISFHQSNFFYEKQIGIYEKSWVTKKIIDEIISSISFHQFRFIKLLLRKSNRNIYEESWMINKIISSISFHQFHFIKLLLRKTNQNIWKNLGLWLTNIFMDRLVNFLKYQLNWYLLDHLTNIG